MPVQTVTPTMSFVMTLMAPVAAPAVRDLYNTQKTIGSTTGDCRDAIETIQDYHPEKFLRTLGSYQQRPKKCVIYRLALQE
tara:strand:- start:587 stop:829 length:243 start_codon:yes stop_codon:yes gene_type:complete